MSDLRRRVEHLETLASPRGRSSEEVIAALKRAPKGVLRLASRGLLSGGHDSVRGMPIEWDATHIRLLDPRTGRVLEEHLREPDARGGAEVDQEGRLLVR